jgi:DNA-binding NarL/FixJ family response regulator
VSNFSKSVFLTPVGATDGDDPGKLCERCQTVSIVVLSGQRAAMLCALQRMFGGSLNVRTEICSHDKAPAAQPNEQKPLINRSQLSTSDLVLTERQLNVLALMMQGKSNKAICRVLKIAEPTVKNHVTAILRVLKVSNRTQAVIAVGELGWKLPTTAPLGVQSTSRRSNSNATSSAVS